MLLYQTEDAAHLGEWMTTEQMVEGDKVVFKTAKQKQLTVPCNLVGGYQKDIRKDLDIHDNTMKACWDVFGSK